MQCNYFFKKNSKGLFFFEKVYYASLSAVIVDKLEKVEKGWKELISLKRLKRIRKLLMSLDIRSKIKNS